MRYSPLLANIEGASEIEENPAVVFSEAFTNAQLSTARRGRFGSAWPLFHFWRIEDDGSMGIINSVIEPILHEAVAKRRAVQKEENVNEKEEIGEDDSLLDHLVKYTQGMVLR